IDGTDVTTVSQATERRQCLESELARYLRLPTGVAALERVILFGSLVSGKAHSDAEKALIAEV
ncbi:MAG: nucleotidyltransferase domain-containing protein, partial [Chloroflexota bacterium]